MDCQMLDKGFVNKYGWGDLVGRGGDKTFWVILLQICLSMLHSMTSNWRGGAQLFFMLLSLGRQKFPNVRVGGGCDIFTIAHFNPTPVLPCPVVIVDNSLIVFFFVANWMHHLVSANMILSSIECVVFCLHKPPLDHENESNHGVFNRFSDLSMQLKLKQWWWTSIIEISILV